MAPSEAGRDAISIQEQHASSRIGLATLRLRPPLTRLVNGAEWWPQLWSTGLSKEYPALACIFPAFSFSQSRSSPPVVHLRALAPPPSRPAPRETFSPFSYAPFS